MVSINLVLIETFVTLNLEERTLYSNHVVRSSEDLVVS